MKVIEFIGMPRAGKTEQITRLSNYLKEKGIKHTIITDREIEKELNVPLQKAFEYNILFFNKILDKMLTSIHSNIFDFIILDRGFSEGEIWFNLENKQGNLSDQDREIAINYVKNLKKYIDLIIFIIVSPETTIQRHIKKGETGKSDDYVFQNYLNNLYLEYLNLKENLKYTQNVIIINGTESPENIELKIRQFISSRLF